MLLLLLLLLSRLLLLLLLLLCGRLMLMPEPLLLYMMRLGCAVGVCGTVSYAVSAHSRVRWRAEWMRHSAEELREADTDACTVLAC